MDILSSVLLVTLKNCGSILLVHRIQALATLQPATKLSDIRTQILLWPAPDSQKLVINLCCPPYFIGEAALLFLSLRVAVPRRLVHGGAETRLPPASRAHARLARSAPVDPTTSLANLVLSGLAHPRGRVLHARRLLRSAQGAERRSPAQGEVHPPAVLAASIAPSRALLLRMDGNAGLVHGLRSAGKRIQAEARPSARATLNARDAPTSLPRVRARRRSLPSRWSIAASLCGTSRSVHRAVRLVAERGRLQRCRSVRSFVSDERSRGPARQDGTTWIGHNGF
eukprot:scaffold312_cov256-Pinguiococcus_pyrenoidosus.AAC.11